MKVTQQSKMADSYQEDLDSLKRILKKDNEEMIERVNAENAVKVSRLQKEVSKYFTVTLYERVMIFLMPVWIKVDVGI